MPNDNALGEYLKDRRSKLDPSSLGLPMTRRRTPGLRREEVALRANVSPTWYTWLEQGRGGTPSADVLDRLARGLNLSDSEREHLFLLAQNRPPEVKIPENPTVPPEIVRVLDALEYSPASVRSPAWDVLAANRATIALFHAFGPKQAPYNVLEAFFRRLEGGVWNESESALLEVARVVVAQFRADAYRGGYGPRVRQVVDDLLAWSPLFRRIWGEHEVDVGHEPVKTFTLPGDVRITFETTSLTVDGRPGMKLVIFNPATPEDRDKVRRLLAAAP